MRAGGWTPRRCGVGGRRQLRDGDTVVVDADSGTLTFHANPTQAPLLA